jgi:hypothetical protein
MRKVELESGEVFDFEEGKFDSIRNTFNGFQVNRIECLCCGKMTGVEWLHEGICQNCQNEST